MSTRILVNTQLAAGQQLAEFIDVINDALAKGRRLKKQVDSMSWGDDWAQVEAEFGCPQGQGRNLWTILSNAVAQIDSVQIAELARLDQG